MLEQDTTTVDMFAAAAMSAALSNPVISQRFVAEDGEIRCTLLARFAYTQAKAMFAVRKEIGIESNLLL